MMNRKFSQEALSHILDQSIMYQCACPAQVCALINQHRSLFNYQMNCLNATDVDCAVHQRIANTVSASHAQMEDCLEDILRLENWDMQSYDMPESVKARILKGL